MTKTMDQIKVALSSAREIFGFGSASDMSWLEKNAELISEVEEAFRELGFNTTKVIDFLCGDVSFEALRTQANNFHTKISGPRSTYVGAPGITRLANFSGQVIHYGNHRIHS